MEEALQLWLFILYQLRNAQIHFTEIYKPRIICKEGHAEPMAPTAIQVVSRLAETAHSHLQLIPSRWRRSSVSPCSRWQTCVILSMLISLVLASLQASSK